MKAFVRSLSFGAEFTIIILAAFGLPIVGSSLYLYGLLLFPDAQSLGIYSSSALYTLFFFELAMLPAISMFLWWRGWRLHDLRPDVSLKLTFGGLLLMLVSNIISFNLVFVFSRIFPSLVQFSEAFIGNLAKPDVYSSALISVMNPVFEEGIVAGYVITALKDRKGVHFAVNTSVAIRLLYHLYEGPLAAISIIPMGLLFAYVYARTERLWPLIVAHAIQDLMGFSSMM